MLSVFLYMFFHLFHLLPDMCWHFIVDIGEQFPPSGFKSFLGASEGRHNLAFAFFLPQFFLCVTPPVFSVHVVSQTRNRMIPFVPNELHRRNGKRYYHPKCCGDRYGKSWLRSE